LGNNLGVLELLRGDALAARERFGRAWDFLTSLDESAGRIHSGLNIGHASALAGDLERARGYLREVRRLVAASQQEGETALWYNHAAWVSARSGEHLEALRALLRSWALYARVGNPVQRLRVQSNAAVADYYRLTQRGLDRDDSLAAGVPKTAVDAIPCLQQSYSDLMRYGYGVWIYPRSWDDRGWGRRYGRWSQPYRGDFEPWLEPGSRARDPPPLSYLWARLNAATVMALE
jgi:hypothetical protein